MNPLKPGCSSVPIVESWVTRPVIVSWRLMSGADSEHVPGELGTAETRRMRR